MGCGPNGEKCDSCQCDSHIENEIVTMEDVHDCILKCWEIIEDLKDFKLKMENDTPEAQKANRAYIDHLTSIISLYDVHFKILLHEHNSLMQ